MQLQQTRVFHSAWLQPLRWWHLYSIDAPTVAVVWMLAFARAAHVHLPLWIPASLALCCWGFYLLDRIFDARRALLTVQYSRMRTRHLHHWRRRRILFPLACLALLIACILALWQMPSPAFMRNGMLAAAALVYFSSVHTRNAARSLFRFKELMVALIFTAACTVPVLARVQSVSVFLPAELAYVALAWLNCHAIESWEVANTAFSFIVRLFSLVSVAAVLVASAFLLKSQPLTIALLFCAAISAAILFLLDRRRHMHSPLTLRICADLALLTPVVLLLPMVHP